MDGSRSSEGASTRPYPHYPADVDDIVGHAAGLRRYAQQVVLLGDSVHWRVQQSSLFVDGSLETPLESVDGAVLKSAAEIDESARYAAAVLTRWATAIQVYDQAIDALNADVASASVSTIENPIGELTDDQRRQFGGRLQQLEAELDVEAARVAGLLQRGPNADDIAALTAAGLMPASGHTDDPALKSAFDKTGHNYPGAAFPVDELSPEERAAWWALLTPAEQVAVMSARALRLGRSDGIPAGARDEANRIVLADTLENLEQAEADGTLTDDRARALANARAVRDGLATAEATIDPITGDPVVAQLLIFEPDAFDGDGRAAISIGDVDTADDVAFSVPGLGTEVPGGIQTQVDRSSALYDEARLQNLGGRTTAIVGWVGYDAPSGGVAWDTVGVIRDDDARDGAALLAADVAAVQVLRGSDPPHMTVIGHSYGSTTTALAATEEELETNDIVLVGSPGAGEADDAGDFQIGADHVFVGAASRDAVTWFGNHGWVNAGSLSLGDDPAEDDFGAVRFQAESVYRGSNDNFEDHSRYWDDNSESLANIAAIVNANYTAVMRAEYRYDPWHTDPQDPEWDREPTSR